MPSPFTGWYGFALGALGVIGATVAVCMGKIDAPTYIGIVGPVLGVGVGAGVHAAGTAVPTVPPAVQTVTPPAVTLAP